MIWENILLTAIRNEDTKMIDKAMEHKIEDSGDLYTIIESPYHIFVKVFPLVIKYQNPAS